jgi:hypothetical protein
MLLIVIAVAASVLMYAYVSGLMGGLQGGAVQQPYLEQISLDYYDWTTLSTLKLTLRNVGVTTITMSDFFIAGSKSTSAPTFGPGCSQGVLTVKLSCVVTFPVPSSIASALTRGVAYSVRIATKEGAIFSYSCIAGQTS